MLKPIGGREGKKWGEERGEVGGGGEVLMFREVLMLTDWRRGGGEVGGGKGGSEGGKWGEGRGEWWEGRGKWWEERGKWREGRGEVAGGEGEGGGGGGGLQGKDIMVF